MSPSKKSAEVELAQLKSALRFLADEWEEEASQGLNVSKRAAAASRAGLAQGKSKAHYEAAGAIHLVVNMVSTLEEDNPIGPLSVVRQILRSFTGRR